MKIGIDTRSLLLPITGIGRYTQQIIKHLHKVKKSTDEIIYFWGAGYEETDYMIDDIGKSEHTHNLGLRGTQTLWEQFILPRRISKHNLDVFHSPRNYNLPFLSFNREVSLIVTMHDTLPFLFPEQYPYSRLVKWRWHLATRKADKIITVSKNSKKDLLKTFKNLKDDDIIVNYCGLDEKFFFNNIDRERLDEVKNKYDLNKPYILTTGGTEPIKNSKMLFEVMKYLTDMNVELAIVGAKWPGEEIPKGKPDNVKFTGYVEEKDFPVLMNGAEIFVFPSLYEGFGLPPLEAMGAGTMVIASNKASVPEVIGDAGILLEPKDIDGWVEAIKSALADEKKKKKYVNKGLERVNKFSWTKTAEELYSIYEKEVWKKNNK
ncbi:glycosyltransferase family 4 protein [Acetohalobium arabaticum]|uniref:Glycosyl transferase group 1 n=1 Tax=Acetohalobium arabaticum (strain ATCC 49924 / DSM 5501 / Z-7288) TaxID=574087 RepID=D9QTR9_ACEAZ|nr:glycosyltransferase family 1 protein [Acetohalobium arabaticum]ADL13640.1 glycosyl transferase group 1 [Acetohalobium arabaticum DSM 5501]